MQSMSATELKIRTGEVLRRVGGGEKVLITKKGKPCAVLSPVSEEEIPAPGLRPYAEAWADIEKTLNSSPPRHETWQEAMQWIRRRD
jgi:prevent-host-death family protein